MRRPVAIASWATWTSGGVAIARAPLGAEAGAPLGAWPEAAPLAKIHPRARRPHPSARQLVQLTHALLTHRAALGAPPALDRTGLVLSTRAGCAAADLEFFGQCTQRGAAFGSPSTFVYTLPTAALGEVSIALGLRGGLETVSAGERSDLAAVVSAAGRVARGELDAAVCGAFELPRTTDGKAAFAPAVELISLFLVEPAERAGAAGRPVEMTTTQGATDALALAAHLAAGGPVRLDPTA